MIAPSFLSRHITSMSTRRADAIVKQQRDLHEHKIQADGDAQTALRLAEYRAQCRARDLAVSAAGNP